MHKVLALLNSGFYNRKGFFCSVYVDNFRRLSQRIGTAISDSLFTFAGCVRNSSNVFSHSFSKK